MTTGKKTKRQTMLPQALRIRRMIEQHRLQ